MPEYIEIQNHRLRLRVSMPGSHYQGPRFDWSGMIDQIELDGKHTFLTSRSSNLENKTEGFGLCNEFGLFKPVGYDEIAVGDWFPKLGVGLLRKISDEPYSHRCPYEVSPSTMQWEAASEHVQFRSEQAEYNGYAWKIGKSIKLYDSSIVIESEVTNTGHKIINTHEYNHNFLSLNHALIGPEYRLAFHQPLRSMKIREDLLTESRTYGWLQNPKTSFYWRPAEIHGESIHWELTHTTHRIGIREIALFPVQMVAVWGQDHVVSPEMFVELVLKPGEIRSWVRKYEFFSW